MPLYEYQCDACGHRYERIQKFSDPLVDTCPSCGQSARRLVSSPAIQFKGSGWYITDYARAGKPGGEGSDAKGETDAKAAKDAKDGRDGKEGKDAKDGKDRKDGKDSKPAAADSPAPSPEKTKDKAGSKKPD